MKKTAGIFFTVFGALGVVLGLILNIKRQMSFSIVGGADGPTSVFVAGKVGGGTGGSIIVVGVVLALAGVVLLCRSRRK